MEDKNFHTSHETCAHSRRKATGANVEAYIFTDVDVEIGANEVFHMNFTVPHLTQWFVRWSNKCSAVPISSSFGRCPFRGNTQRRLGRKAGALLLSGLEEVGLGTPIGLTDELA